MKKIFAILALMMFYPVSLWATVGTCVQTPYSYAGGIVRVVFVCTGGTAGDAGTIDTQTVETATMKVLTGTYYLYLVEAKPAAGGTAPDAADVAVLMSGLDQLGAQGANLIHATETRDVYPYSAFMSKDRFVPVRSTITMTVTNQATASANFTIELIFVR